MALLLSSAARLKPEIRLAEAVSHFEASLSTEDKAKFGDQRTQALSCPPSTMDVMRFTAQIDRGLASKGGRCLGPRFTNFLSSVQQFAALGDVIVGGSQNIIACGVWSVVRMSILALTKHSAYLEDMSVIMMEVGRSSPRYQALALLYSRSPALQASIHEYFIIVVRFCSDMMEFTRKSAFAQLASSLNSESTKKAKSDLVRWANEIGSETSMLLAKRIEDEAMENSRFRLVSNTFSKSLSEQQVLARKFRILDECSKYDHETTWKQIRKAGNTSLFSSDPAYQDWKSATESCTLLYYGQLGCGKSVAMANMVDDLSISSGQHHVPVVYFFVRHDLPESLKARTVIGSLARQLLRLKETFLDVIRVQGQVVDTYLTVQDIIALLQQTYTAENKVYLILDGLDLCEHTEKLEIINFVEQLQLFRWLLACVSLRQKSVHKVESVYQGFVRIKKSSFPDNNSDIEDFVEAELARCLRNHTLVLGDARLILKIHDALLSGSRGMFLWVVLQIRTLCTMATDNDLLAALEDLPTDLEETYRRILDQARGQWKRYQSTILSFIIVAQQPLVLEELREALSVTVGDTDWTSTNTINDIENILTTCGCLVQVDEEERTVRFVHPSVQIYLIRWPNTLSLANDWQRDGRLLMKRCHITLAEVIVTYLSYGVLEKRVSTARIQPVSGGAALTKIVESVTTRSSSAQRLALRFLEHRKRPTFDLSKALAQEVGLPRSSNPDDFVFQHYAKKWCLYHIGACHGDDLGRHIAPLLPNLLERHIDDTELAPETAFRTAVEHNNEQLLRLLLSHNFPKSVKCRFETRHRDRPISYTLVDLAVCKGNKRIVEILVPHADRPVLSECSKPYFAACDLIHRGLLNGMLRQRVSHGEIVRSLHLLPEHYMHVCQSGKSVLACAVWGSNVSAVKALLDDPLFRSHMDRTKNCMIVKEALQTQDMDALELIQESKEITLSEDERSMLVNYARERGLMGAIRVLDLWTIVDRESSSTAPNGTNGSLRDDM